MRILNMARFIMLVIALSAGTFSYLRSQEAKNVTVEVADPKDDPRYSVLLDRSSFDQTMMSLNPQTPAEVAYNAEQSRYDSAVADAAAVVRSKEDQSTIFMNAALFVGLIFAVLLFPWARWVSGLSRSADQARRNALRVAAKAAHAVRDNQPGSSPIIGRSNLTTYSVADELGKWQKLRDDGVVTEEEFNQSRDRLLNRK